MRASGGLVVVMVATAQAGPSDLPTYTPLYQPSADPLVDHNGRHFEVDCGFALQSGTTRTANFRSLHLSGAPGPACSVEVGLWLGRRVNVDVRAVAAISSSDQDSVVTGFLGPTLQVWFDENLWAGIGVGGAVMDGHSVAAIDGPAWELRLGGSFGNYAAADSPGPRHRATFSIEVIDSSLSGGMLDMTTASLFSVFVLVGYMQL